MLQRIDALAVKLQEGLSSSLRDSGFETLEVRERDRLGDQDAKIEQHRLHQMAYLEGMSVAFRQEHANALASVQGAKHRQGGWQITQHPVGLFDSSGRKMVWNFTSATPAVCS